MADRKIYIEVEWDDADAKAKARALDVAFDTLGRQGAASATRSVGALEAAVQRARASHTAAVPAVNAVSNAVKAAVVPVNNLTSAFTTGVFRGNAYWDMLKGGVRTVKDVAVGLFSDAIAESNRFNNAMIGLMSVAGAFGQDLTKTKQAAQDLAKDGLMTVAEAAAGLKNLIGSRFGLDEAISLMNAFKDSAAFNRQGQLEFGQAIVGATEGIKNQMSMMVDNAGVTKNLGLILKEAGYKEQDLGRAATDVGVRMALLNGILRETIAFKGDAAKLTQTYSGQMSKLDTAWKMTIKTWGDAVTTNATVATAIGMVTNALLDSNVGATNNGKAWTFVSDVLIGLVKVGAELLVWFDYAQTGANGLLMVAAELAGGLLNLTAITMKATLALLRWTQFANPGLWFGAGKAALATLEGQLVGLEKMYDKTAEISNAAIQRSVTWGNALQTNAANLRQVAKELEGTKGKLVEVGAAGGKVGAALASAAQSAADLEKQAKLLAKGAFWGEVDPLLLAQIQGFSFAMNDFVTETGNAEDAMDDLRRMIAEVNGELQQIGGTATNQPMLGLLENMDYIFRSELPKAGKTAATSFKASFKDAFVDIADIIIDTIVNGGDWKTAARAVSARLGGALGESIGSYFGPVGAAIGNMLGTAIGAGVAKVLFGPTAAEDIKRRVSQWGRPISDGLAQAIADAAKQFGGNRQAAEIFSLDRILGETGLDSGNITQMTAKLRDVFVMLQTGLFTAAQATTVLNTNWAAFVEAGTDGSGRLSEGLREIIRLTKQHGLEVKAVTEYLKAQANAAITGSNAVVLSLSNEFEQYQKIADSIKTAQQRIDELNQVEARGRGVEWARDMAEAQAKLTQGLTEQHAASEAARGDLELMGSIALATYQAAIDAGMTHSEALRAASPALLALQTAYENLGISAEESGLKALMVQAAILKNNPMLLAGIDGLSQSMIALHNMGALNEETFRKMEQAALRMYTKLQAEVEKAGGTTKDALLPMQDYLREAEKQAKLLGIPLDAQTQMLIDQSKELGIWKDAGKDANRTMLDGLDDLTTVMMDLVSILRNDLPSAAGAAADGMNDAFNRVRPPNTDIRVPTGGGNGPGVPPPDDGSGRSGVQGASGGDAPPIVVVTVVAEQNLSPQEIGEIASAAVAKHIPRNGHGLRTIISDTVAGSVPATS